MTNAIDRGGPALARRRVSIWHLIGLTSMIRLVFAATTGLGNDESYMVAAGRVLSIGYFDHPPASWWLSWGAAHLFGTEAPWAVRLPFILLFALSQWLVWRIGCLVADERAGFWGAVALNLSPVFGLTTGTWVLPDGPLDTALLAAALCLLHALPARGRRAFCWWLGAGVCAGLGLFSKYSAVLTVGGAFFYLLAEKQHRGWLRRPEPYVAGVVALAVFSPVPIWNALHGWASFAFQGDRAEGLRFRPWLVLQTLGGEALFVLPWIWVPMMMVWVPAFRRTAPWQHRLLAWLAAPPIVLFAAISAWSSQRILYHWAAPGYLMLFPLLGVALSRWMRLAWVRRTIAGTAVLLLVAMAVISLQMQFDIVGGRLAAVMKRDPTAEGMNWTSLQTGLVADGVWAPGQPVAVLNWRDGGKIGYGLGAGTHVVCLNRDSRQFGFADPPATYKGETLAVVALAPAARAVALAAPWFEKVDVLKPVPVRLDGRTVLTATVLRGIGFRGKR